MTTKILPKDRVRLNKKRKTHMRRRGSNNVAQVGTYCEPKRAAFRTAPILHTGNWSEVNCERCLFYKPE